MANVVVRTRTIYTTAGHVDLVQAVISHAGSLSQTCAVVAVRTRNAGSKQSMFYLLVAKDRGNPVVGARNGGRVMQVVTVCSLNGRLSVHEKRSLKTGGHSDRWSRKTGYTVPMISVNISQSFIHT